MNELGWGGIAHCSHGVMICHHAEAIRKLIAFDLRPYRLDERLHDITHLLTSNSPIVDARSTRGDGITPGHECHFHIDLCKLWLSVFSAVFVTETLG
jgi:hypothetical protein